MACLKADPGRHLEIPSLSLVAGIFVQLIYPEVRSPGTLSSPASPLRTANLYLCAVRGTTLMPIGDSLKVASLKRP